MKKHPQRAASCLLLLALTLLSGCGDSTGAASGAATPSDADVKQYVQARLGDQLFTTMMRLNGQDGELRAMLKNQPPGFPPPGMPPGGPPPGFGNPPGVPPGAMPGQRGGRPQDPADRYVEGLNARRPFDRWNERMELTSNLYDCDLPAKITSLEVTDHKVINEDTHSFQIQVTQELQVALLRLRNSLNLRQAIEWDDALLQPARRDAQNLPANVRAELEPEWMAAEKSRRYVMERMHESGSQWTSTGEVRATRQGDGWNYDLRQLTLADKPSVSFVTPDKALPGLMTVDPQNYQASAEEWRQPYDKFIAKVAQLAGEQDTSIAEREQRLAEMVVADKSWTANVAGSALSAEITLKITRVNDKGMIYGEFSAARDGKETIVPVYGYPIQLAESDVREKQLNVAEDLLGPAIIMQVEEPEKWPQPWNELEFYLGLKADAQQPTLIWLNQVQELQPVQ